MTIINLGAWPRYIPEWPEEDSRHDAIHTAAWWKSEQHGDWYDFVRSPEAPKGSAAVLDAEGNVKQVGKDLTYLVPDYGVTIIVAPDEPEYLALTGKCLDDGVLVDRPAAPKTVLSKATLWRRLTDDEADALDGALAAAPARLRRIFEAAAHFDIADPDYPALRDCIIAALGEERSGEVLAPEA